MNNDPNTEWPSTPEEVAQKNAYTACNTDEHEANLRAVETPADLDAAMELWRECLDANGWVPIDYPADETVAHLDPEPAPTQLAVTGPTYADLLVVIALAVIFAGLMLTSNQRERLNSGHAKRT